MKKLLTSLSLLTIGISYSQVGINNSSPKATLDVTGAPTNTALADGIIFPKLTGNELKAKDAAYNSNHTGATVYVTAAASPTSTKTANVTGPGFYYYDGNAWQFTNNINANAVENGLSVNSNKIEMGGQITKPTTLWGVTNTNKFSITGSGTNSISFDGSTLSVDPDNNRVGVNTTAPNAALEVAGTPANTTIADGVIFPKLTGNELKGKDAVYNNNHIGTIVYATAAASPTSTKTANVTGAGFYYYDGSVWQKVGSISDFWSLKGNTGTTPTAYISNASAQAGNYIGTNDNQNLTLYTNAGAASNNKSSMILHTTTAVDGTATPQADIFSLRRNGASSVAYSSTFGVSLGKYASGVNGASKAVFKLGNGATELPNTDIMTLQSNGNVGVGTTTPNANLEVAGNPTNTAAADGVVFPKLTGNELKGKDAAYNTNHTGAFVYVTAAASPTSTKTANVTKAGFYYYDGNVWQFTNNINANAVENGLSVNNNKVELGGSLTKATTISNISDTNKLAITGSGNNAVSIDGSTFSVDADNNRVGINTTSPESNLQVNGTTLSSLYMSEIQTIDLTNITTTMYTATWVDKSIIVYTGTPAASINITQMYGEADGRIVFIYNFTNQNLVFTNGGSGTSYPPTYFYNKNGSITLQPNEALMAIHLNGQDTTKGRWYAHKLN